MSITVRQARSGDQDALALVGATTFLESYAGVVDGGALESRPEVREQTCGDRIAVVWAVPDRFLHGLSAASRGPKQTPLGSHEL